MISLYIGTKTKVKVRTPFSGEFMVNVAVRQGSALSPLLFAIVIDVVTNEIKVMRNIVHRWFCFDSEEHGGSALKTFAWKSALESKGLKVNLVKTKVMVSKIGQISMKPSSKKYPCGICGRKTMANAVLCKSCGNWMHGRCAKIKRVTDTLAIDFKCWKFKECRKNGDHEEKLHEDVETVTDFSYLGDRINSGGGCEAAVTSRTRFGWVNFTDFQDLLYKKHFL